MRKLKIIIVIIFLLFCNILEICPIKATCSIQNQNISPLALGAEKVLIARFTTSYNQDSLERSHNIGLASDSINGTILKPSSVISFNKMTGERTKEKGYKEAKVIQNGQYTVGLGGGVCQVSSTLYNALLIADLHIIEVHAHSIRPYYVKPSMDAMVSFYSHDLVFQNDKDFSIVIYAKAGLGSVTVDIYGDKKEDNISYISEELGQIDPPEPLMIDDVEGKYKDKVIYKEQTYALTKPRSGLKSRLIKIKDGKETLVREDTYSAIQGVFVRGVL